MVTKEEVYSICWSIEGLIKDISAICFSYLTKIVYERNVYQKRME
jgi:hypothetical protein